MKRVRRSKRAKSTLARAWKKSDTEENDGRNASIIRDFWNDSICQTTESRNRYESFHLSGQRRAIRMVDRDVARLSALLSISSSREAIRAQLWRRLCRGPSSIIIYRRLTLPRCLPSIPLYFARQRAAVLSAIGERKKYLVGKNRWNKINWYADTSPAINI